MASVILLIAIACILIYQSYKWMFYKPPNFPPGPPRLPFFGSYPFLLLINYFNIHSAVSFLHRYYKSNIIGFYYANYLVMSAGDANSVKQMLVDPTLDGRSPMYLAILRDPDFAQTGIFFTDGPFWKNQRRFVLRHLRDFGYGRRFTKFEMEVNDEMLSFLDMIRNPKYPHEKEIIQNGKILAPYIFSILETNMFIELLIEQRFNREDQRKIFNATHRFMEFQRNSCAWGCIFSVQPILAHIFPKLTKYAKIKSASDDTYQFVKDLVDEQIKTFDETHERSFLDRYIKEMKEAEEKNEPTYFYYKQLLLTCMDFFFPTLTSLPLVISTIFIHALRFPGVQEKIQKEIDDVVGRGRLPLLDDRNNMPYTDACIRESMRFDTPVPSAILHRAMEPTTFMGYDIPENTICVPSLFETHNDKGVWGDPKVFRPERFLDENGKFSPKLDQSIPFSFGRRVCTAETFSRNMIFLTITAIFQNFNVRVPDGHKLPEGKEVQTNIIRVPKDFWLQLDER